MKIIIIFLITAAGFINMYAQSNTTVKYVDLNKYLGLWYQIARMPNRFQDDNEKNTTAQYSLNEDGTIKVLNKSIEDGEVNTADGVARVVDKKSNAKLEVSFVSFLGINFFWGDYWIIGLADDYSYAVVGHPERKYGWILSRTKTLPKETLDEINILLKKKGYNPDNFIKTKQE